MPCFHPLDAWQCSNGDVVFTDNLARNDVIRRLALPCGRCVGCRLERSRQWAVRCMHEASMHMFNSFVTLTYDDDHFPWPSFGPFLEYLSCVLLLVVL